MSRGNFEHGLEFVLSHEGGFSNYRDDPGGMTMYGITKRVYDEFYGAEANEDTMRNMPLERAEEIYETNYWKPIKGDNLPSGIDVFCFDWAVNGGVARAGYCLQKSLQMSKDEIDGVIGPYTLSQIFNDELRDLIYLMHEDRENYYRSLPHFDTFGKGWLRRNDEARDLAHELSDFA
jgi:lysozyme family protein